MKSKILGSIVSAGRKAFSAIKSAGSKAKTMVKVAVAGLAGTVATTQTASAQVTYPTFDFSAVETLLTAGVAIGSGWLIYKIAKRWFGKATS